MKKSEPIKWPTRTVLVSSRIKAGFLLAMCLTFVGTGVFLRDSFDETWMPWLIIGFFGICASVFVLQLFRPGQLVFTAYGFEQTILGRRKSYRWDEVSDFSMKTVKNGMFNAASYVTFSVLDSPSGVVQNANKLLIGTTDMLGDNFGMKTMELLRVMNRYRDDALANAPSSSRKPI